ncbi:MAG TPA: hypothetical protein VL095_00785 [Flavisolibacter sp.]|nr:hypothetical protein [Flavisolibacter sp.]
MSLTFAVGNAIQHYGSVITEYKLFLLEVPTSPSNSLSIEDGEGSCTQPLLFEDALLFAQVLYYKK